MQYGNPYAHISPIEASCRILVPSDRKVNLATNPIKPTDPGGGLGSGEAARQLAAGQQRRR